MLSLPTSHIFLGCCFCLIDVRGAPNGTSTLHKHEQLSGVLLKHVGSHVATTTLTIKEVRGEERSVIIQRSVTLHFQNKNKAPYTK